MNERAQWRHRRVVIAIVVSSFLAAATVWGYQQLVEWMTTYSGIRSVVVTCVQLSDESLRDDIEAWLNERRQSGYLLAVSREVLAQELLDEFPLVRKVSLSMYVPGRIHCAVVGVKPKYLINDQYVGGNNGRLYAKKDFLSQIDLLPKIHIAKQWTLSSVYGSVHNFFATMPHSFLKNYHIYYHDPYTIVLVPRNMLELAHKYACLIDEKSAVSVRAAGEIMALCDDLKTRTHTTHKEAICFFDFRFQDRVVSKMIPKSEFEQLQRVE